MKFEKEITLRPLLSGYSKLDYAHKPKGTPYYEQVLLIEDDYPFAMVHVDMFWPGKRDITPEDKYQIYDALNSGKSVTVRMSFQELWDDNWDE